MDILDKVRSFREEENKLKWEGTFAEYLDIVKRKKRSCSNGTFPRL